MTIGVFSLNLSSLNLTLNKDSMNPTSSQKMAVQKCTV